MCRSRPTSAVEFTTLSRSPAVDTKIEIFGDGVRHESGYIVIFGGWNNTISTIARLDEHERGRKEMRRGRETDRLYHWTVQRTDGKTVELFIDGEKVRLVRRPRSAGRAEERQARVHVVGERGRVRRPQDHSAPLTRFTLAAS